MMAEPERIGEIIPRVLALFVRKAGYTKRLLWPTSCDNCKGRGTVEATEYHVAMKCGACEGRGYLRG